MTKKSAKKVTQKKNLKLTRDEKYHLYESSVQNPEADVKFIRKEYQKVFNKEPLVLREDFCGTGSMACEWVAQSENHTAFGIDLDVEPISYGLDHHFLTMPEDAQSRMKYILGNVLNDYDFKADIIVAFNFSYFLFKKRSDLVAYFSKVRLHLNKEGLLFIDLFGGTETRKELEESNKHKSHTYFWDCHSYNPLTAECQYYIHFKDHKTGVKHEKVFSYDWRMWDAKELQDVLNDAGFNDVQIYWEGVDKDGTGNGVFKMYKTAENCESWVTYIKAKV
jgi:hypothetical protein